MQYGSFIKRIENSLRKNWNYDALTDYEGATLQYKDVARKIEKFHIVFEASGIQKGDRIAICGKNSANWCLSFIAVVTYGAVAVPIQREFKADDVTNIVRHSGAKVLIVSPRLWENMQENDMPDLYGAVSIKDYSVLYTCDERFRDIIDHRNELFGKKYKYNFRANDISYREESPEELALINYTSGTTGYSKGVMLPYRSLELNIEYLSGKLPLKAGDNIVSMLPLGHVFGMTCDFLNSICCGTHLWFLTRQPSPKIITTVVAQINPKVICTVPLIVEKIIKKLVLPKVDNQRSNLLLHLPIVSEHIKNKARQEAMNCFGNNIHSIIIGGAPLNADIELFLRKIKFPYTIAYGLTETGPLITHSNPDEARPHSCGQKILDIEIKIDSPNKNGVGELLCRGGNLMLGYYKNPEATSDVIDCDGWFHTGDMASIDNDGFVYLRGRCKNMFLGAAGENIYPEPIESKLNNMEGVAESVVIKQNEQLVALIYPDASQVEPDASADFVEKLMLSNIKTLNKELPGYSQISRVELWPEPFEKTAKNSIKRYLYLRQ